MPGRFNRASAIRQPGIFLSQPPIATTPSKPSQPATVSIESAITSRDTSEYFMPSVPIEMPSEIVIVPKMTALPPASLTPMDASTASLSMCMLHGVTMLQVEAMPICDFLKSSLEKPTACNMARLAARSAPSTIVDEKARCKLEAAAFFINTEGHFQQKKRRRQAHELAGV